MLFVSHLFEILTTTDSANAFFSAFTQTIFKKAQLSQYAKSVLQNVFPADTADTR